MGTIRDMTGTAGSATTVRVALIGRGIGPSRTPRMHMAEGAALGFDYRYELMDAEASPELCFEQLVDRARVAGLAGVNVTYPFKREALALVDRASDAARRVGAVNTIVFSERGLEGHNTDYWGFAQAMRQGLPGASLDTVVLVGAGGAGGAVAHSLADLGAGRLLIHDRDAASAEGLAEAVNAAAGRAIAERLDDVGAGLGAADGVVNATPVGMAKLPGSPVEPSLLDPRHWVADIVYFPLETELLAAARARGCATLDGGRMAIFQAARAFELFTGATPDAERMRASFHAAAEATA
ncbi:shikimate dehydrogenase [Roseobacter sp. HKCCA0434]|uniref:shikimate dehydrogenase n=1 Tax=Roseobacter sp. HKCCA0434 TaxID=3079297 RepID=UPI002905B239|nr:shikimate dehydrogenase [Roseobacter sp. HKCCA0434]